MAATAIPGWVKSVGHRWVTPGGHHHSIAILTSERAGFEDLRVHAQADAGVHFSLFHGG